MCDNWKPADLTYLINPLGIGKSEQARLLQLKDYQIPVTAYESPWTLKRFLRWWT